MKRAFATIDRGVSDHGDTVVKLQQPQTSRRERLRTAAGRDVGETTGLFTVPAIRAFDDARGEIVFERLPVTDSWPVLADPAHATAFVTNAGTALAAIHRHLRVSDPGSGATRAPGTALDVGRGRPLVPLHGDFGIGNIFELPAAGRLAIIDWTNADWLETDADVGAPEIDLAVFLVSLFHRRLFLRHSATSRAAMGRQFLTTYAAAAPHGLDLDVLRAVVATSTPRFNRLTRHRKGGLRSLGYRHSMIHLDFFLRRLSAADVGV